MARGGAEGASLQVEGYRSLLRALALADKAQKRELRETLRYAGEAVQRGAQALIAGKDVKTAAGYKVRVRQRGVAVEQSLRKTSGLHAEWGAYQMTHALIPSLYANEDETNRRMEAALDAIALRFNEGGLSLSTTS